MATIGLFVGAGGILTGCGSGSGGTARKDGASEQDAVSADGVAGKGGSPAGDAAADASGGATNDGGALTSDAADRQDAGGAAGAGGSRSVDGGPAVGGHGGSAGAGGTKTNGGETGSAGTGGAETGGKGGGGVSGSGGAEGGAVGGPGGSWSPATPLADGCLPVSPDSPPNKLAIPGRGTLTVAAFGHDNTDGSGVFWNQNYPSPCFNDDPTRASQVNAAWQADYFLQGDSVCLEVHALRTQYPPVHQIQVGYALALTGTTFADGTTSKNVVVVTFSGSPATHDAGVCVDLAPPSP